MSRRITLKSFLVIFGLALGVGALWYGSFLRADAAELPWPLERGARRAKLLTFGMYVTPTADQNPIDPPERFTGYHTGLDLEIFSDEKERSVPVLAICDGTVVYVNWVEGYGGTLVQSCVIRDQAVTVLYGHLAIDSISKKINEALATGEKIGNLGADHTEETSGNRKHLHLAIHKGSAIELHGYAQTEHELETYI